MQGYGKSFGVLHRRCAAFLLVAALTVTVCGAVGPAAVAKKKKTKRATYIVSVEGHQNTDITRSDCPGSGVERVSFASGPMTAKVTAKPGKDPRFVFLNDEGMDDGTPLFGAPASVYRDASFGAPCGEGLSGPACGTTQTSLWGLGMFAENDRIGIFATADGELSDFCLGAQVFPYFIEDATGQQLDTALPQNQLMKAKQKLTASATATETVTSGPLSSGVRLLTFDVAWTITLDPVKKT
jgi:hypothetical protein